MDEPVEVRDVSGEGGLEAFFDLLALAVQGVAWLFYFVVVVPMNWLILKRIRRRG